MDKVKLVVTQESFDKNFSIDEWFNFSDLTQKEVYEKMLLFAADENGSPLTEKEAQKRFRKIPKKEWGEYLSAFMNAVSEAFVNPTNGSS